MTTQHTDGVEAIVDKMLAIGWDSKMKKHDGTSIVVSFTKAELCDLLLNLQANQSQQVEEAVRKYLQEKVVLYVSDNQSHESLSHEDRLKINADECIIYLGDEVKDVWGDDWNDAPDYCNSGSPYENTVKGLVKIEVKLGKPLLTPNHPD